MSKLSWPRDAQRLGGRLGQVLQNMIHVNWPMLRLLGTFFSFNSLETKVFHKRC